ncbi:NPCBM/NEW2 domain-containing protein [Verrucomicrobiaceae bacterium 227]
MSRFFTSVGLLGLLSIGQAMSRDVPAALKILDGWHQENPKKEERKLHFILWTPNDREPPENYDERTPRIMEHIQAFYAREMARHGFGPRTINLPYDGEGKMVIHLSKGKHATSHYEMDSGQEVRRDCLETLAAAGIDGEKETIVMFCNLATWDEEALKFTHKSPYYAGGNHQRGNAWQLDSPELDTTNLAAKSPMIHDGQYGHISLGKHNSIFIGGVAHELGHAIGLPHCRETVEESVRGNALMGAGNRSYGDELRGDGKGSFLTLAHALKLASHPMFSGSGKGINFPVKSSLHDLAITAEGKTMTVAGRVEAHPPVYAVIAYFDPAGGSDYDARTASAVPDKDGNFSLSCSDFPAGKAGELRIVPLHVNGGTAGWLSNSPFRYPYLVTAEGQPDLAALTLKKELRPLIEALQRRQSEEARDAASRLTGRAAEIAGHLLAPTGTGSPSGDTASKEASLTSFSPTSSKVGWSRPTFDALPEAPFLLEAGGQIFDRGIYGHAPAHHEYELGGSWSKLEGQVGMLSGKAGTVQFEIRGDGKVLWRSGTVRDGKSMPFSVEVPGVKKLTLNVHPTNDGTGSDWGLWLDPVLRR